MSTGSERVVKLNVIAWDFGGGGAKIADGRQKRQHFEVL